MGILPAEALIECKLRTKLPDLRPKAMLDEEQCDADNLSKMTGKDYSNEKQGTIPSNIKVGNKILVQQSQRQVCLTISHDTL